MVAGLPGVGKAAPARSFGNTTLLSVGTLWRASMVTRSSGVVGLRAVTAAEHAGASSRAPTAAASPLLPGHGEHTKPQSPPNQRHASAQNRLRRLGVALHPRVGGRPTIRHAAEPAASPQTVLVISDIHGNAAALSAVMQREHNCDAVVFLGDSVLSGPQVRETMELLQALHAAKADRAWISGNHDEEMLHPELIENYPPTWKALNDWILGQFEPSDYTFVRENYTEEGEYEVGGIRMQLAHGAGPPGADRNALPSSSDERLEMMGEGSRCETVGFSLSISSDINDYLPRQARDTS
eukprot:COSAG06_NODE_62_length_27058_cov_17.867725_21_plen_296_part_00